MSEGKLERPTGTHRRGLSSDFRQPRDLTLSKRLLLVKEWLRPELHLDGLDLTSLPDDVSYLDHLEEISMRDNKLETLPDIFSQLTNLKVLDLGNNKIREIPPAIFNLPSLEKILLNDNQISQIPTDISRLTTLKTLHVAFNSISSLPLELTKLVNLESLMVEGNKLSEWPAELSALQKLNHIYIWNNLFTTFPKNMLLLPHLLTVSIEGNLIDEFDEEMWKIVSSNKYTIKHSLPCQFAPRLYLGDSTASKNLKGLQKSNITNILVLDGVVQFPDNFSYKVNLIDDSEDQDILGVIDELHNWIDNCLAATPRGSVMIHCGFGVSRSPTIAISYLMKRRGYTFENALAQIRTTRPSAQPNPGFVRQLRSLE